MQSEFIQPNDLPISCRNIFSVVLFFPFDLSMQVAPHRVSPEWWDYHHCELLVQGEYKHLPAPWISLLQTTVSNRALLARAVIVRSALQQTVCFNVEN